MENNNGITDAINEIIKTTEDIMTTWRNVYGYAPDSAAKKLDEAMLDWIIEMTECLRLWVIKGEELEIGELILARVNLGALVESWLKFFYCVYYEDYLANPIKDRKGIIKEPEEFSFEALKVFSRDILWDKNSRFDRWVEKVQRMRNAIHIFTFRDIGSPSEFLEDICIYNEFIEKIIFRLPEDPREYR